MPGRRILFALLLLAAFGAGYLAGRSDPASARAPHAPASGVFTAPSAGRAIDVRSQTVSPTTAAASESLDHPSADEPGDTVVFVPRYHVGNGRFEKWYRVYRDAFHLPEIDDEVLGDFGSEVISALGHIPRPEILRPLLREYSQLHATLYEIWDDLARAGLACKENGLPPPDHRPYEARENNALLAFFNAIETFLPHSDLRLLLGSDQGWDSRAEQAGFKPGPPRPGGPRGADPFEMGNALFRLDVFEQRFSSWYRGFRTELDLPELDELFLDDFGSSVIEPLEHIPPARRLRKLIELYAQHAPRLEDGQEGAVRDFFRALRQELPPLDYRRMRFSTRWIDACSDAGVEPSQD